MLDWTDGDRTASYSSFKQLDKERALFSSPPTRSARKSSSRPPSPILRARGFPSVDVDFPAKPYPVRFQSLSSKSRILVHGTPTRADMMHGGNALYDIARVAAPR